MKIQTIFEAFEQFKLGQDDPTTLFSWISSGLLKVNFQNKVIPVLSVTYGCIIQMQ